ncbi:MAG TPA: hypothetical protein VJ600_09815 [Holophagaceae bacterium]|nr:hypothetical protein [Holophagaceae bacterium]
MLLTRQIETLESLRAQPYQPPAALMDWAEELDEMGRPWMVQWTAPEGGDPRTWLLLDTETQDGRLYLEDESDVLEGKWYHEYQRFHAEDGTWIDLMGHLHSYGEDDPTETEEEEPGEPVE